MALDERETPQGHPPGMGETAQLRIGLGQLKAGNPALALPPLRAALSAAPSDPFIRYTFAVALLRTGFAEEALSAFEQMLKDTPDHSGAAFGVALARHALGDRSGALNVLRQITASDPLAWKAWDSVADITPDETERISALDHSATALKQLCNGPDPGAVLLAAAADALLAAHRPIEAEWLLRSKGGRIRGNTAAGRQLARVLYHQGRFADAFGEACLLLAQTEDPVDAPKRRPAFAPGKATDVLAEILGILSSGGVTAFLAAGTLLGFQRNGGPLAHDRDVDIGVIRNPGGGPDIAGILRAHDTLLLPRMTRPGDRYIGLEHRGVGVDIFLHDETNGHLTCGFSDLTGDIQWRFTKFGVTSAGFNGHQWHIPDKPQRYLEEAYGSGWAVPDKGFASVVSSPALYRTDARARAYYAAMRARTARLTGDTEKANALIHQSPIPLPFSFAERGDHIRGRPG